LDGEGADVLVCGASFAGLAVARELAGAGADVLLVDRYEIGERATSACAAPTPWLWAMGVEDSIRQEIPCMRFTTPKGSVRYRLPWSWSAFDYRELCRLLFAQSDARFETAKVDGRGEAAGEGADRGARRPPAPRRRPLPGQLVPASPARRGRGRRLLRGRQRRTLLPAVRRGDPHRLLLRHRLRPRAARGPGRRARPRGRAGGLPRLQRRPRARVSPRAAGAAADAGAAPARPDRPAAGDGAPGDRRPRLRLVPRPGA